MEIPNYEDVAPGQASVPANQRLTQKQAADLHMASEDDAVKEAKDHIKEPTARDCKNLRGCKKMRWVDSGLLGDAVSGEPELVKGTIHATIVIGRRPRHIKIAWDEWVVRAEQKYYVTFECVSQG